MEIPISEAKGRLTELVRRAATGDEVVLTRHGQPVVRLVPIGSRPTPEAKRRLMEEVQRSAAAKASPGECAARSQDFLYDEDGLPA